MTCLSWLSPIFSGFGPNNVFLRHAVEDKCVPSNGVGLNVIWHYPTRQKKKTGLKTCSSQRELLRGGGWGFQESQVFKAAKTGEEVFPRHFGQFLYLVTPDNIWQHQNQLQYLDREYFHTHFWTISSQLNTHKSPPNPPKSTKTFVHPHSNQTSL